MRGYRACTQREKSNDFSRCLRCFDATAERCRAAGGGQDCRVGVLPGFVKSLVVVSHGGVA